MTDYEKKIINMFEIIDGADNTNWKKLKEWSGSNEHKAKVVLGQYEQGQIDLINEIKRKVAKLEETVTIQDFPFDVLHLLKTIDVIKK